jgi:hypothetical protein
MAAPYNPPVKNEDFIFYVALRSASTGRFLATPTVHADDFKVKKDAGAFANLGTTPSQDNAGEYVLKVTVSSTEMNADNVVLRFRDVTDPPEWEDVVISIPTTV